LILDGSLDQGFYFPVGQWSRAFDATPFDAVHLPSGESVPPLIGYTHLLLTGSEASFEEPEPWFDVEARVVREAVNRGLSILGSCFGHQMLVWALSGFEHVRRAPTPELGWVAVEILVEDSLLGALPNPWHTFSAHMDEVVAPPEPWRILASNHACGVQAMRYGNRPIWGIQPHPETQPDEARALMLGAIEKYPEYAERIRLAMGSPVRDDAVARRLMSAFLRS